MTIQEDSKIAAEQDSIHVLWTLLHQATEAIGRAREKELAEHGIALRQVAALYVINHLIETKGEAVTPTELSQWLFRRPNTISSILDRMEREGLIHKGKDNQRRNLVRVSLTEKGKAAYRKSTQRESLHQVMSVLSTEEQDVLFGYLERLRDGALKYMGVDEKPPLPLGRNG
jgi:MarR family transcriptional regulator, organic hydroperoxide resistance regulator